MPIEDPERLAHDYIRFLSEDSPEARVARGGQGTWRATEALNGLDHDILGIHFSIEFYTGGEAYSLTVTTKNDLEAIREMRMHYRNDVPKWGKVFRQNNGVARELLRDSK